MSSDVLSLPPSEAGATALAPGFRFHPTDDELVSYYLRRKIVGRPLRVDAISEVDLYKVEPWDLPSKSRIQSRDTEWYFFSPLDKKYATRSRTSRTTGQGYWKTTGKDRAVKHGSRVAGMKKTLVFHIGKAPHGDRTNWVMHEYRLTDDDLAKAGVPQDSYVVCRIFQKNGAGPQNGAQYGASFVEEEWEDDDKWIVPKEEDAKGRHIDFGDRQCMQAVENSDEEGMHIENEKETAPSGSENVCNYVLDNNMHSQFGIQADDDKYFINGPDQLSEAQNDQDLYHANMEENIVLSETPTDQVHIEDYLELNDFACPLAADHLPSQDPVIYDDVNLGNNGSLSQLENSNSRDTEASTKNFSGCVAPIAMNADNLFNIEMSEIFDPPVDVYFPTGNAGDTMEYFDAPSQIPAVEPDAFFIGMDEPDAPDLVDELLAFFDATEDDLSCTYLDPVTVDSPKPNPAQFTFEANQDSASGFHTSTWGTNPNRNDGLLSPTEVAPSGELPATPLSQSPPAHNLTCTKSDNSSTSDARFGSGWHKSLTNHFVNMLDSISSPPAFAEPLPSRHAKSLNLSQSSSSIRFTAGVVQLNTISAGLNRKSFSVKKGDPSVFLSYAMSQNDILDGPEAFDSIRKLNSGPGCWLIGSGFCLSFISVLFLAASFGVYICAR